MFKVRTTATASRLIQRRSRSLALYLKPGYRCTDWVSEENGKSYSTEYGARVAARGFLRQIEGEGYRRLTNILGRPPVADDLEIAEYVITEVGVAPVNGVFCG